MFMSFDDLPDDLKERLEQQIDMAHMKAEDNRRSVDTFLEELSVEDAMALRTILEIVSRNSSAVHFFDGQIVALMKYKYKICPGCGKDHEQDLLEMVNSGTLDEPETEPLPPGEIAVDGGVQPPLSPTVLDPLTDDEIIAIENARIRSLLAEYNVHLIVPEGMIGDGRLNEMMAVQCNGCGVDSQSLKDRMINRPGVEGCEGCMNKAKWG